MGHRNQQERFAHVSVIIVDYDMPGMNGIEFCRQLSEYPMKKIMLTGKATQAIAVEAFNGGLIDCFLLKHQEDISSTIREEVRIRQDDYFDDITSSVKFALSLQSPDPLDDDAFRDTFHRLRLKHNIVEYYLTARPEGVLMIRDDGSWMVMLVFDQTLLDDEMSS